MGFVIAAFLLQCLTVSVTAKQYPTYRDIDELMSSVLTHALDDFRNGRFLNDIPLDLKVFFQDAITQNIPENPHFSTYGLLESDYFPVIPANALSLHLPPRKPTVSLPDPLTVFDAVFLRKQGTIPDKIMNTLLATFVNTVLDDVFVSNKGMTGPDSKPMLSLKSVYGWTPSRQALLRKHSQGKLRTSRMNGEEVALMWKDEPTANSSLEFVLGDDNFNRHWGYIFWISIFTLVHNEFCDMIIKESPSLSDDEVFARARLALVILHFRVVTEDYIITLAASHLSGKALWRVKPMTDCQASFRPNSNIYLEFNHLYRWHNLIPDTFLYRQPVDLSAFSNARLFTQFTLQEHFTALYQTPAGAFVPNNVHRVFKNVTASTIAQERQIGVRSYNEYARAYGSPPASSFADLTKESNLSAKLQELYTSIDNLDLFTGLFMQQPEPAMGKTLLFMVAAHAFSFLHYAICLVDLSHISINTWGKPLYDLVMESDQPFLTLMLNRFRHDDRDNTLFSHKQELKTPVGMPGLFEFSFSNLCDFVGLNMMWDPIMKAESWQQAFLISLATGSAVMLSTAFLFRGALPRLKSFLAAASSGTNLQEDDMDLVALNFLLGILYALIMPLYSVAAFLFLFSDRFDLAAPAVWPYVMVSVCLHISLYVADITIRSRLRKLNWMLVAHHAVYCMAVFVSLYYKDIFSAKISLLLDYMTVFEFGLFFLIAFSKLNQRVLPLAWVYFGRFAVGVFALSRVVQTVLMILIFEGSYTRMRHYNLLGIYFFQVGIFAFFTFAQGHSLWEYSKWKSLWKPKESVIVFHH